MSDNSPTSERWRWVVPIVVAVIAAIGTVIAALAPSLFGGDEEAAPTQRRPDHKHLRWPSG